MNVLIIPEDFRYDQFVLKPIVTAMLKALGRPNTIIEVCQNPPLRGISTALKWSSQLAIINQYKYKVDLFLLCVDKDNDREREKKLRNLEKLANAELARSAKKRLFLATQAEQEVEVWILAGHKLPKDWVWQDIRDERDSKERYFEPFAQQRGFKTNFDEARQVLANEAVSNYDRIKRRCPEVADLESRIRIWIESQPQ